MLKLMGKEILTFLRGKFFVLISKPVTIICPPSLRLGGHNGLGSSLIWLHIVCNIGYQGTYADKRADNKSCDWKERVKY